MMHFTPRQALLAALIATTAFSGCAITDSDAKQALEMTDSPSALDTPQADWKTPFWERSPGADGNAQAGAAAPAFQRRDEPLNNVGVLLEGSLAQVPAFLAALHEGAAEHGFVIVPGGALSEALSNTQGCAAPMQSDECLAGLAVYPGLRLLARLTPDGSGGVNVTVRDITRDASASAHLATHDQAAAATLLDEMAAQAGSARWSVRAFDGGDGNLYISAGRRNGLDLGTELEVRQPGQPIHTPTGQVVAWRPGAVAGTVKVTQWVGESMAVVELVSGAAPTANDWLTLPRK